MKNIIVVCIALILLFSVSEGNRMKPLQSDVLYPTVRVECRGTGSGVVFHAEDGFSLILTAKHVLAKKHKCRVTVYPDEITYPAKVLKVSKEHDLAILKIEAEAPYVANLPDEFYYENTTPVWKAGAGHGHTPFVTKGLLGDSEGYHIMFTAPVVGGDSGGGVYAKRNKRYVLIGIVTAHATDPAGHVHHLGYAHNWDALMEFIAE